MRKRKDFQDDFLVEVGEAEHMAEVTELCSQNADALKMKTITIAVFITVFLELVHSTARQEDRNLLFMAAGLT